MFPLKHSSRTSEAIHGIVVQDIPCCVVRYLSGISRGRAKRAAAERDLGGLAANSDGKGAPRPQMDGRTANRQLQCADRHAGNQAAAECLPACSDKLINRSNA